MLIQNLGDMLFDTDSIISCIFLEFHLGTGSIWRRTYFPDKLSFSYSAGHSRRLWGSMSWRWFPWALLTEETRRCSRPYKVPQFPLCSGGEFSHLHFLKCELHWHRLSKLVRASVIWSLDSAACHVYSFFSYFDLAINPRYLCYLWKDFDTTFCLSDKLALCFHALVCDCEVHCKFVGHFVCRTGAWMNLTFRFPSSAIIPALMYPRSSSVSTDPLQLNIMCTLVYALPLRGKLEQSLMFVLQYLCRI